MAGNVTLTESAIAAALDDLRATGADRVDPVRFRLIEALHRRAAAQAGDARDMLFQRLNRLLERYADRVQPTVPAAHTADTADNAACPCEPVQGPLAELLRDIASRARPAGQGAMSGTYPELGMLDDFRAIWARVSAETQLRQSLDKVPSNAGPLNSSSLVHRSLVRMRELSPAYLRQFLSYVDALSWLEQMSELSTVAARDSTRTGGARKSQRGKAR